MRRIAHIVLWLGFLICFGFAGGGAVLLYADVPLEAFLQHHIFSQPTINHIMTTTIVLWGILVFFSSFIYYRLCLRRRNYTLSILTVFVCFFAAAGMFRMFMSTDSPIMASFQGKETISSSDRLMYGPYPDDAKLKELRHEGYTYDITLLSPDIPFEKSLLDEEKKKASNLGIHVYSYPMLPWIGDNSKSLEGVKELVESHPNDKFYIHCYLGKHRAMMVKRMLDGSVTLAKPELPPRLTRGLLYPYMHGKVLLGPYPTRVEWFHLIQSGQVREVISTLEPSNPADKPWIEEAQKICSENNIQFLQIPLDPEYPSPAAVNKIVEHVRNTKYTAFVFEFANGKRFWTLDEAFSKIH